MKILTYSGGTFLKKYFFIPIILFIFALTNDDVQRRESPKASAFANKESGKYRCTGKARFFNYMRDSVEIFNEKQRFAKYLNKKHIPQPTNIAKENRKRPFKTNLKYRLNITV